MYINSVNVEFDSVKNDINRAKHDVSLTAASGFDWDTAIERGDDRFDYDEVRFVAIGLIESRLYVMVFTDGTNDDAVRVISLLRAEKHEARFYHDQV